MSYKRTRKEFEADLQAQQSPFITYGTPLPPLDSDTRDDGSYVPVWKQEIVDEHGRKRLHGAFTGGFSAGYFNTVGSKEGWTPSTFVSSLSNRHKNEEQKVGTRPEDFMDDEDLAAASEAQNLELNEGFSGLGSTGGDARRKAGLLDLFRNEGDSMGAKLLRKMGWRDGQGVGPKVRRKLRQEADETNGHKLGDDHLFAPDDSPMVCFERKDDNKGAGYDGEARLSKTEELARPELESSMSVLNSHTAAGQRLSGFGVGVLNDQGSDEDEFTVGPRILYNRTIGGDKKTKKKFAGATSATKNANPLLKSKPVYRPKKDLLSTSGFRRCRDGKLPLKGFILATEAGQSMLLYQEQEHRPPEVPKDWKSTKTPQTESNEAYQSSADAAKASKLDARSRAAILGEVQLPGKSIFDFMSTSARDRLAFVSGKTDLPLALGEKPPTDPKPQKAGIPSSYIPKVDKSVASAALKRGSAGWMPYAEDPAKRSRYQTFLEHQAETREGPPQRAPEVAQEQWLQELREFAHAAEVFKPVSGVIASRFASASSVPEGGTENPSEGQLKMPTMFEKKLDPAEEAARLGMFGPMTRSTTQFFPTRLVCKRFKVRLPPHAEANPDDDSTPADGSSTRAGPRPQQQTSDVLSEQTMQSMREHAQQERSAPQRLIEAGASTDAHGSNPPGSGLAEVDASRNDALEGKRAGEAVFRAVFGDDSDSD